MLPMIRTVLLALLFAGWVVGVQAQERTSAQGYDAQINWSTLSNQINLLKTQNGALASTIGKMQTCAAKNALYKPSDPKKDADGCVKLEPAPFSDLDLVRVTKTQCWRSGYYTLEAACPSGKHLLACSGGPGDQGEDHEYWVLDPDFKNNKCLGYVGQPACFGAYYSQTIVTAICY